MKWKNNGIDGGMHGKEWTRWIYVRQGSLWIFSFLLDCFSRLPANNNYVFLLFSFFLFFLFFFFFEKQLGYLKEVFTLVVFPECLKGGFHPWIFLFFFIFFSSLGCLTRFSTQWWDSGASWRFSPEPFYLFFIFIFIFAMNWWGRSWNLLHHHHCFIYIVNELLFW